MINRALETQILYIYSEVINQSNCEILGWSRISYIYQETKIHIYEPNQIIDTHKQRDIISEVDEDTEEETESYRVLAN